MADGVSISVDNLCWVDSICPFQTILNRPFLHLWGGVRGHYKYILSMNLLTIPWNLCRWIFLFIALGLPFSVHNKIIAQELTVVFEDDFSSDELNSGKFQPDSPFFEGGVGDIHAEVGDGVLRFVGATTQQWWSGATLRIVPTFNATPETPVTISIDRVAEQGQGSASRSALWILDETGQNYVLFADVRGEGGWRFNRKIGEDGDAPTGSGTDIAAFNGPEFDDGGFHTMSMVADGETVKLLLDGQEGASVRFPFNNVTFHFGAYARANGDTANTTFDNVRVQTVLRQGSVLFEDDFSSDTIDPTRYTPDTPFFEGGVGDIHAEPGDGVMQFVGTTTQQWWSGGTLRIVPTFAPSEGEKVTLSIDRVAEAGVGSASRSALWIMDTAQNNYVLFADVRGEGGWRFNRKIGEDGDAPTGSGTDIAAFNGPEFDDGGLHRMSIEADGKTVKLYLDGILGTEVRFPFSPVIFQFGAFARANGDTANTTWDNLLIESEGGATFDPSQVGVLKGQVSQDVIVRIPLGANAQGPVTLNVISSNPSVAYPEGAPDGNLEITFPAGGANTAAFKVFGVDLGGAEFEIQGGLASANRLQVAVLSDPGVVLEDDFSGGSINTSRWQISDQPFGTGSGEFSVTQSGGQLHIAGFPFVSTWGGASLKTTQSFIATRDLNLSFEMDRVSVAQDIGVRTGVFITNDDRSRFVFFSQNSGDNIEANINVWQVNTNPGNPTGNGTTIPVFNQFADTGSHRMKLVANGQDVEVFLDGVSGGRFAFEAQAGIHFEIGAYAELAEAFDEVTAVFDNVTIENTLPCISLQPEGSFLTIADRQTITVGIPQLLNASDVSVTVTSSDPSVAVPAGGSNGALTLNFPAGGPVEATFTVVPVGLGAATFNLSTDADVCVRSLPVEVVAFPEVLLTDDFSGNAFDSTKWRLDETPFDNGTATPDSSVTLQEGQVVVDVTVATDLFPGLALFTQDTFSPSATEPLTFEISRKKLEFVLTTGTGSEQRTGIWVRDPNGNFVFFNDYVAHDGRNFGWRYNKSTGQSDDDVTGPGVNIAAFDGAAFNDRGDHRLKMIINGSTVKLFLDDVFGAQVDFPFSEDLSVGFGAYADEVGNVAIGYFDDARILGGMGVPPEQPGDPAVLSVTLEGGNVMINWTESGTLQVTDSLVPPVQWSDVTPEPTGNALSIPAIQGGAGYYRVVH